MKDPNFAIAFTIGKYTIYWYAVLLVLGIVAALVILDRRTRGGLFPRISPWICASWACPPACWGQGSLPAFQAR